MGMHLRSLAALFAALLVTACAEAPAPAAAAPPTAPTTAATQLQPQDGVRALAGVTGGCPTSHRWPLSVQTRVPEEVRYLTKMTACTDDYGRSLWLRNDSDAVWTLTAGPGARAVRGRDKAVQKSFRSLIRDAYGYAYEVSLPGSAVVVTDAPERVAWHLHPGFSAAWVVHAQMVDRVADYGRKHLKRALSGRSPQRTAVVTCTVEAAVIAGEFGEGLSGPDPAGTLVNHLGVVSGAGECASAWTAADRASPRASGKRPTWRSMASALGDRSTGLSRSNSFLKGLHAVGRVALVLK